MRTSARAPRSRTAPWWGAAVLLVGASGWWASPAQAESPTPAESQSLDVVTFSGGCGVEPRSTPDRPDVSVSPESELGFLNDIGHSVVLRLNGVDAARVKPGDAAVVRFHDGPVEVTMYPGCLRDESPEAVTVSVFQEELPDSTPPASSSPPGTSSPGPPTSGPSSPSPATSAPHSTRPPASSSATSAAPSRAAAPPGSGTGDDRGPGPPSAGSVDRLPTGGSSPSGQADRAGWSPVVPPARPDPEPTSASSGDPADMSVFDRPGSVDGGGLPPDPATVEGLATVVDSERDLSAGSLSRTTKPVGDQFGLLALIATVCVVGVSAAVVRAIIAERANRVEWA